MVDSVVVATGSVVRLPVLQSSVMLLQLHGGVDHLMAPKRAADHVTAQHVSVLRSGFVHVKWF
ncbi:hypothetical protein CJD44_16015 [Streptomyces sp. alain-838]|nr:hypothetical protein CJD44_16015 [Streptomyces sp. alain-838]